MADAALVVLRDVKVNDRKATVFLHRDHLAVVDADREVEVPWPSVRHASWRAGLLGATILLIADAGRTFEITRVRRKHAPEVHRAVVSLVTAAQG